VGAPDAHRAVDAVWRMESARVISGLARMVRDVGLAEDLAQEALVAALETWPRSGVPDNPGAWLMATAKNRWIDLVRRSTRLQDKTEILARDLGIVMAAGMAAPWEEGIGDDVLALVFTCCHPAVSREGRVALTLRMVGGLRTEEIARAFLVDSRTVGQRISRAKKTLSRADAPFAVPEGEELDERLPGVLEVVYLIFNEGYAATRGEQWMRPALVGDALRLGRVLAGLAPREPEVHGLVALMELQASRMRARRGPDGQPVLLMDQDRRGWDLLLIGRGLRALDRAEALGGALGPYAVQAAIAACHARARTPEATDWVRIAALYDRLSEVAPSPVVELNRAVALGMAYGPDAGLALVDAIEATGALEGYHLLPSVRGEMLERLGRAEEARAAFAAAAALTQNEHERAVLLARAGATSPGSPPRP
jgi:RNA polymerase sigma-70 factor (ECF subfamily)